MNHKRIALCLRYDGSQYHGWQVQKGLVTVQSKLEHALSSVANHPIHVYCAGRTDAGVHASAQIVHFDTDVERSEHAWVFGANSNLPHDMSVLWAREVDNSFHARFSAVSRRYRYVLYNQEVRPGILRNAVGWWYKPLDYELMQQAANVLLGEHDFSSFRGSGCQAHSPVRTIHQLEIGRVGEMLILEVKANAFLLHMVRNIAGMLVMIGSGERKLAWAEEVLAARNRQAAGITISPAGLYLVEVEYPPEFKFPAVSMGPFFLP